MCLNCKRLTPEQAKKFMESIKYSEPVTDSSLLGRKKQLRSIKKLMKQLKSFTKTK